MRVLIVGWPSFEHGEATAGDVMAMNAVADGVASAGFDYDIAWSKVMCPPGGLRLADADPSRYTHLVFVCGPLAGGPVRELAKRFKNCTRIAIGVSVIDPYSPELSEFHHVLFRDRPGFTGRSDLSTGVTTQGTPVIGVIFTHGQNEYGRRREHERVISALNSWLNTLTEYACIELDTRLDPRDWRLASGPGQLETIVRRLDAVVTMRLHGLVLALKNNVPALAVDPVAGGAKLTSQAHAWRWPAALTPETLSPLRLREQLNWCLSDAGRRAAQQAHPKSSPSEQLAELNELLLTTAPARTQSQSSSRTAPES